MENKFVITSGGGETLIECLNNGMRILAIPLGEKREPDLTAFEIYATLKDETRSELERFMHPNYYTFRITGLDRPEALQWSLDLFYSAINFYCIERFQMEAERFNYDGSPQSFSYLPDEFFGLREDQCSPGTWKHLNGECSAEEAEELDRLYELNKQ